MRRIVVTGGDGFIGRNACLAFDREVEFDVASVDVRDGQVPFDEALTNCDVVVHLAGVNRPLCEDEFEKGNVGSLSEVVETLERQERKPLVVFASSTQALLDNPYGRSKLRAEEVLFSFSRRVGIPVRVLRLPGVFGKFCRPNYNSVVATFCHNLARELPISLSDPSREIELIHVDDVVRRIIHLSREEAVGAEFVALTPVFTVSLGRLADLLREFRSSRESLLIPDLADSFIRRLYSTYISYLPKDAFAYALHQRTDARGALAEVLRTPNAGQIFVSQTRPGIARGNHYHDMKVEKFAVLQGDASIQFRHMVTNERVKYSVSGQEFKVVDIPPGWTHSIENVGATEMIVLFWASEVFDPARPDTFAAEA